MEENFFVAILVQKQTQSRSKNVTRALCFQSEEHKVKSVYNKVDNTKRPYPVPYAASFAFILIVGGVHGWVGVGLLCLLFLVPYNHLHRLRPGDLRLLLLGLVIVHSRGSLSLNVGQVLERRHLDDN